MPKTAAAVNHSFRAVVKEHRFNQTKSRKAKKGKKGKTGFPGACPSTPQWVKDLENNPPLIDYNAVVVGAARHFADSIVPASQSGAGARRRDAEELAGVLLGLLRPRISSAQKLWLAKLPDPDIRRWCSELFGVGAGIALLEEGGVVDMRLVRKPEPLKGSKAAPIFDFIGRVHAHGAPVNLEFKGTLDGVSTGKHRSSFKKKLRNSGGLGAGSRGYGIAIGVIFKGWTSADKRDCDFEVMDPGEPRPPEEERAVRELLEYYAARYDDGVGMPVAAERLRKLARHPDLFSSEAVVRAAVGADIQIERRFSRAALTLEDERASQTYWGGFWRTDSVPFPQVEVGGSKPADYPDAYVGIDCRVIREVRKRDFRRLLELRWRPRSFRLFDGEGDQCGIGVATADGTLVVWCFESRTPRTVYIDPA